jgi:hypothetical protein
MSITACDEAEPTHKSLTIFRQLVEIGDPALLTAELLGIPSMPNEAELSSAITAFCHRCLRLLSVPIAAAGSASHLAIKS